MTSVDSGVETGNSNDSLVTQHENIPAGQAGVSSSTFMSTAGNKMEGEENRNEAIAINLRSIASIRSDLETYIASTNNTPFNNKPGTSGPLTFHFSDSLKVMKLSNSERRSSGPMLSTTVEILKSIYGESPVSSCDSNTRQGNFSNRFTPKMKKLCNQRCIRWGDKGYLTKPFNERKMRIAAASNNVEMMRSLLVRGISPNNKDEQERTPLHLASCRGYTEIVQMLLEHGADPNQRDCIGNTPLHLATVTSKISVVTLLLKAGTDVLSFDKHGHNPLQIAQTKLKLLQACQGSDMIKVKEEVHSIVEMLLAYLQKQKSAQDQVESLSNFYSRLSLSSTSNQIQDDVRDLLANLNSLSLTS